MGKEKYNQGKGPITLMKEYTEALHPELVGKGFEFCGSLESKIGRKLSKSERENFAYKIGRVLIGPLNREIRGRTPLFRRKIPKNQVN